MGDQRPYLVEFYAQLDDAGRSALDWAGVTVGASGGGTVAPGADLPERDHHYATVHAEDEGTAAAKVADALTGAGVTFTPGGVTYL